ncbi:MAG: cytochrome c family protein [Bacteroidales bacterium]|nr:cytochrome c family protein [Bacteroidales bacterium]MCF8405970.1 cytochrome c family protein [Bacteroidales bacterium]
MSKKIFQRISLLPVFILCFLSGPQNLHANSETGDSVSVIHKLHSEELVRGERLFYGLIYSGEKAVNCASCHNTRFSDSLNWNPDAYEISLKYKDLPVNDLSAVLLNPKGAKLSEVHNEFDLTEADVVLIKAYMDEIAVSGLVQAKPIMNKLILFIFMIIVIVLALAELIFIKKLKPKWIHLLLIMAALTYIGNTLVKESIAIGRSQFYSPDQPIKFSHTIHAGQNQTNCLYCHPSAEYSKSAGIPSANVCMNCHLIVRSGTHSGTWEINKVIAAYENNMPVEWIRIHNNPDHVFFSHAQHVSVGKVACQECHGEVEKMDRLIQVSDLSMGWCINCHREKEVEFHTNKFYNEYEDLAEKVKSGELDMVSVEKVGGTECMKCHY